MSSEKVSITPKRRKIDVNHLDFNEATKSSAVTDTQSLCLSPATNVSTSSTRPPPQLSLPPPPPPPLPQLPPTPSTTSEETKLVKLNWKPIMPMQLTKECIWRKHIEVEPLSEDILLALTENFASKPNKKKIESSLVSKCRLKIIDESSAYNLSIILRSSFKKSSYEQIRQYILNCDTTMLRVNFIMGLIKCLPQEDRINQLRKLRNDGVTLLDVEDFLASLCDIHRIVPRLHCIKILMEFNDMVKNVEINIEVATKACDEVLSCSRFHKILRLILSIGNIMNAGTQIGGAVGFELPALTTLIDTKSSNNKRTLLDFVVETFVKKYPDLLYFGDELCHLHEAVDTKFTDIEETIKNIEGLLHFVESELEKVKASPSAHDTTFIEVMSDFITHHNFDNIGQLTKNMRHMQESYMKIADLFAFDMNKYKISECLKDIMKFKNMFKQKLTEITKSCKSSQKLPTQKIHPKSSSYNTINGTCRNFSIKLSRLTKEEIALATGSKTSRKRKQAG